MLRDDRSSLIVAVVRLQPFLVTLLILVSATWFGLYLAKRITRPVQMLAEGAKAIGAGQLDLRLEAETGDELGSLVEAFNMMAADCELELASRMQPKLVAQLFWQNQTPRLIDRENFLHDIINGICQ